MSACLDAALGYARARRPVFPVRGDKKPYTEHGFLDASIDEATIREWWKRWPDAGVAMPTGSGFFVLDVDDPAALSALAAKHGPLPPTRRVVTPRGGVHIYLRGDGVRNAIGVPLKGLDIRGAGGYTLIPPSPGYEWRDEDEGVATAPAWLLELLKPSVNGTAPPVEGDIPAQQRNSTLTSMAGTMRRRGFSEAAITSALLVENRDRCKPPLSDREVRGIAHNVSRYKPADDAVGSLERLNELLGLAEVDKRVDWVRVYGRGGKARVCLHLDNGSQIVLDPLGPFSSPVKMNFEITAQAGATPTLKAPGVQEVVKLFYLLAEHHQRGELADLAWEHGAEYLRNAAIAEVDMHNQASRWEAFAALESSTRTDIVLHDSKTGVRYVRTEWFKAYLRVRSGPGEPAALIAELESLGWDKAGTEGRIKATRPRFGTTLQWAFLKVPKGWEHS
jgi:Bifunctional DNA primase/polymerase, N-terminal/Primase C terminal 1 (PriCT-1)